MYDAAGCVCRLIGLGQQHSQLACRTRAEWIETIVEWHYGASLFDFSFAEAAVTTISAS